jgi:C4-dicarboxylate transporter/malic acid transport protein
VLDRPVSRQANPDIDQAPVGDVVGNFTPNWFAVTMGTGILSLALAQFPHSAALWALGQSLWLANTVVFAAFALLFAARCLCCRSETQAMLRHPVQSMFLGCIPMGFATIVNGLIVFGVPAIGPGVIVVAEALWWVDVVMALVCGIVVPFAMFTRQTHALDQMTAVWLLPLVASEVAAVTGGMLIPHLGDPAHAMTVLVASLALWSCSVPMALGVLVVLFLRLVLHKLPDRSMAPSCWLALGPIATAALALLVFSHAVPDVLAAQGLAGLSDAMAGACLLGAILLWGYGIWWFAIAAAITVHYVRRGLEFNMGWWGYTFPLGVFAVCTLKLGQALHFSPMTMAGMVLIAVLASVWSLVAGRTLAKAWRGMRPARSTAVLRPGKA